MKRVVTLRGGVYFKPWCGLLGQYDQVDQEKKKPRLAKTSLSVWNGETKKTEEVNLRDNKDEA